MKINIEYGFYTDGDFTLKNPEKFGCVSKDITIEDYYFDFFG